MNTDEFNRQLKERIATSTDMVTEAKIFLLASKLGHTHDLLTALLESRDLSIPNTLDLTNSGEEQAIDRIACALSWWNAGVRAVWILQGQGLCIPSSGEVRKLINSIQFASRNANVTTTGNLRLESHILPAVDSIIWVERDEKDCSNLDVFLRNINLSSFSIDISTDLEQCAQCFRRELYLPCLVMLGRAIEGAWVQLGLKLSEEIENAELKTALIAKIDDVFLGVSAKVELINSEYAKKNLFGKLHYKCGVAPKKLAAVKQWSLQMLSYRNAIHPGAEQAIEYDYPTVSALLLSVKSNFETIESVLRRPN